MLQFGEKVDGATYIARPGAYAIAFDEAGRVGVIRHRGWHLPLGGGIDAGESPEAALEREVGEETGRAVRILARLGEAAQYLFEGETGLYWNKIGTFFEAELGEPICGRTDDDHELVWLSADEALVRLTDEFAIWALREALRRRSMQPA